MDATFYDPATGEIILTMTGDTDSIALYLRDLPNAKWVPEKYDPADFYFVGETATERPLMQITWNKTELTVGIDEATASGIPNPSTVAILPGPETGMVQPDPVTITGGQLTFSVQYAGRYNVMVRSFPFKNYEQRIVAYNPVTTAFMIKGT